MDDRIATDGPSVKVNYEQLLEKFGCQSITEEQLNRLAKLTGKDIHYLLKRKIIYAHRDFDVILKLYEEKKPFYLYTGRGPSSGQLHLGHYVPFMITKYLQEIFDIPLVIQITDDEKFLFKSESLEIYQKYAIENIKDIIAIGFQPEKTFIFCNTQYMGKLYPNVLKIQKSVTNLQVQQIFGFRPDDNIGRNSFPAIEIAPVISSCFSHLFPSNTHIQCFISCAIDQEFYE